MTLIIAAARLAHKAHDGQFRKYTNRPYIEHPMRVATRVMLLDGSGESEVAAAWMHDVVEDCDPDFASEIAYNWSPLIWDYVNYLTNTSKQYPELNRAARKTMDREQIAKAPRWARLIKLVDRIDNLKEMAEADRGFLRLYCEESVELGLAIARSASQDNQIQGLVTELFSTIQDTILPKA